MTDAPIPLSEAMFAQVKYYLFFTVTFYFANFITILLTETGGDNTASLSSFLYNIFGNYTQTVLVFVFIMIIGRLLLLVLPELGISKELPLYTAIVPALIISHPLLISVGGSNLLVRWLVLDLIQNSGTMIFITQVLLFSAAGYGLFLMQSRIEIRNSRLHQILKYLGKEFYMILIILIISISIISSYISNAYESVSLDYPVKYVLLYLFFLITAPVEDQEKEYLTENPSETATK